MADLEISAGGTGGGVVIAMSDIVRKTPGITLVDDPMVIDFDRPDEYMRFIKRFYPNTPIEDLDYMNSELVKNYYDKQVRE